MQDTMAETVGFRLSPQQEHLLASGGERAAVAVAATVGPGVAPEALRAALEQVVARHEILRTTFYQPAGMRLAQQAIAEQLAPEWRQQPADVAALIGDPAALDAFVATQAGPFDLQRGPLVRACLAGQDGGPGLLVLCASPTVADATSLLLILEQISAHYGGGAADADPVQYADYSEWRHELLTDEEPESLTAREFWRDEATRRPAAPRLLFSDLQPSEHGPIATVALDLASLDFEALARTAQDAGATMAVLLEAAWHALLARVTGASDLVTAGLVEGRLQDDLAGAVGPYAQAASVTTHVEPATTFAEILDQVRRARAGASRWQDSASAEDLAALARAAGVGFSATQLPTLTAPLDEIVWLSAPYAGVPLALECTTDGRALAGRITYDTGAFVREDVADLARWLPTVLTGILADPAVPVAALNLTQPAERETLIRAAASAHESPADASVAVHNLFERQAQRTPGQPAVADASGSLSYAELDQAANRLANHLRAIAPQAGAPVGLCVERTPAMLVALLAILKSGSPYLPLNFDHPPARIAHQLGESGAGIVITQDHLLDRLPPWDGTVVSLERDAHLVDAQPAEDPGASTTPEGLAYIMYTSGSTGTPKGVAVTHRNLSNYALAALRRLQDAGAGDESPLSFAVVSAISTDLGNTGIFVPLISGGCVRLVSVPASMDATALAAELGRPADAMKITPSHLRALIADGTETAALPSRWLVLGGEALSWELVDQIRAAAPGLEILNHYGPTETTVGCCAYPVAERRSDALTVPIGWALAGDRAYVLDAHLEPVPVGVPGELCIGGVGVATGYVATESDAFVSDPFDPGARIYRTGDRARRLRDGAIEFLGRLDDQVKIRGFRVEPGEIEAVLATHPAIRHAAVNAEADERGDLRLVAYLATSQPPSVPDLQAFLAASLPEYMVPAAFATLPALPFTPSGKIDRAALPGLAEVQTRRAEQSVAPRDDIEREIAAIWASLLGVEEVGAFDDFFALGGHSLMATQAIMRIRRRYGDIPLRALLAAPTVAALADVVRASTEAE